MLTRWMLENFKPIRERLDLPTAPLPVLAGLNSSGKSSFLQSILLVSQTLANQKLDEPLDQFDRTGSFVVLVIADERLADFKVFQEFLCMAGIFAGDERNLVPEDSKGAERNVFQVADWCSHYVESSVQRL